MDRLIRSYGETGLGFLEDSLNLVGGANMRGEWMRMAIYNFEFASNAEGSDFGKAKSMFGVAVCYHLIGEYPNARKWFEAAQKKGQELNQRGVKDIEDFKRSLNYLLSSYRPNLPTLGYCNRLAIESASSSSTYDRVTVDSETLRKEKQVLEQMLQGQINKVNILDDKNKTLQNEYRILQDEKQVLQRNNQRLTNQLSQSNQKMQDMEKAIQELTARLNQTSQKEQKFGADLLTQVLGSSCRRLSGNARVMGSKQLIRKMRHGWRVLVARSG